MDICRQVGANLRRLREEKGWSQEELADRTGLHRTYISGIERGVRNPTVTIIAKISGPLGVKPGSCWVKEITRRRMRSIVVFVPMRRHAINRSSAQAPALSLLHREV